MNERRADSEAVCGGSRRLRETCICLVLFFGTLLLFGRAVNFAFLDYDDPDYVTQNFHVRQGVTVNGARWAFASTDAGNWHPLTWLSHQHDWQFFGNNPSGHHATNIFWHALNAVLAFLALRRLTGTVWTSAAAAALFAWHPLRVESVAWISERKDMLSGFFFFLTLLLYAQYAYARKAVGPRSKIFYTATLFSFACGLMSKPMLVTVPFLLVLLDFWPLKVVSNVEVRNSRWRTVLWEKIPFFLLSAGACVITYLAQKNGGAVVETFPLVVRLQNAVMAVTGYLENFFWPFNLAIGYPLPVRWPIADIAGAMLLIIAITGLTLWQWRRRPFLLIGWLWFLGMLVPVIGIVQVGIQARADRYTYLPILGVEVALLWALREFFFRTAARRFAPALSILIFAGCAVRTWDQLGFWKNSETLYEHALAVTKNNYLAHCYLGSTLFNTNRLADAESHFRRALEIKPDYIAARHRLGLTLEKLGRTEEAFATYNELLDLRPDCVEAHYSMGALLLDQNQSSEAIAHLETALRIKPNFVPALVALGLAEMESGQLAIAVAHYERALTLKPDSAEAHYDLANALILLHRESDALPHYEEALRLNANFEKARANYANLLRKLGHLTEACVQYRRALALDADDAYAHYGLGAALEDLGRSDEALACYQETLRLDANFSAAQERLARLQDRLENAVKK